MTSFKHSVNHLLLYSLKLHSVHCAICWYSFFSSKLDGIIVYNNILLLLCAVCGIYYETLCSWQAQAALYYAKEKKVNKITTTCRVLLKTHG